MKTTTRKADLYLRLSDPAEGALDGREQKLRDRAASLGWTVVRVAIENDTDEDGKPLPASAFKKQKIVVDGEIKRRVIRPVFQSVLSDIKSGRADALLAEDLDRVAREPRDLEDLIEACQETRASAESLSGSLKLTRGGTDAEVLTARIMVGVANKSSSDTARRVSDSRRRLAEKGCYGGGSRRPYGYVPDPHARQYEKTLIVVDAEADVIKAAARDVLSGVSLAMIANGLRDRGIVTVTGAKWRAGTVRDMLLKPAVAGYTTVTYTDDETGTETEKFYDALWQKDAILDRETWQAVVAKLKDESRTTTTGNTPRWLLSGIAVCGVCGGHRDVHVTGAGKSPSYVCSGHLKRKALPVEELVERRIINRLSQPDIADLLRPPARADVDTTELRAEVKRLQQRKAQLTAMFVDTDMDPADIATAMRQVRRRLDAAQSELAASAAPDGLAEFRDPAVDAADVWEGMSLGRRREVLKMLVTVTLLPAKRSGPKFDAGSVRFDWHGDADSEDVSQDVAA